MGAHLLGAEGLHLEYPTRAVLDRVTLGVNEGDRIGVVGRNGDGKSSLLGVLAGTIAPQDGRVTRRNGLRVGLLSQADTLDPAESVEHAVIGDRPEYEWAGQARIRDIIAGLVADIDWHATMGSLSGGQRRRVGLAALLVGEWDLLILDEPTNHLDVEAITWLAGHLTHRWPQNAGGLLVVTHDRWFLDEVCTATWEVHDGVVEPFEGGYAAYVLAGSSATASRPPPRPGGRISCARNWPGCAAAPRPARPNRGSASRPPTSSSPTSRRCATRWSCSAWPSPAWAETSSTSRTSA